MLHPSFQNVVDWVWRLPYGVSVYNWDDDDDDDDDDEVAPNNKPNARTWSSVVLLYASNTQRLVCVFPVSGWYFAKTAKACAKASCLSRSWFLRKDRY